jgi:carbon-monoxide dehydrogenase small subunit
LNYDITLTVNGRRYKLGVDPLRTLVEVLREDLGFTGVKVGCGKGECGACTILLNGKPVNSCLILAVEADGSSILTIEGLSKDGTLHPLQEAFVKYGAAQCGYCTPGMILSAKALLDENPNPSELDVREAISGNLCRCTGYAKIVKAILEAARKGV